MQNLSNLRLPRKSGGWAFDKKICTDGQDLPDFEDLCQGYQGEELTDTIFIPNIKLYKIHENNAFCITRSLVQYQFYMTLYLFSMLVHCLFNASVFINGQPQ